MRGSDSAVRLEEQRPRVIGVCALREPFIRLDVEPERCDRLRTAEVRARQRARDAAGAQDVAQRLSLPASFFVEWAQAIVARPSIAVAGRAVAEQDDRHTCSSKARSRS